MSALIIDDKGSGALVDSADSEVKKLQDLVRKLQVQNQMLLGQSENQSGDSDVDNSAFVVDANCNTDLFQRKTPPPARTSGVLREQQLNTSNSSLLTSIRTTDNVADSVHGAVSPMDQSSADSDVLPTNAEVLTENLSLDTVQLVDVDGKLSDEEESWLYTSPVNAAKNTTLHTSPYEWLRTDFDRPSPELSSARRSLVMKLDLVTKRPSVDLLSKVGVHHKFDIKKALADIQSVNRGDVTEILSIHPAVCSTGRSTPVSGGSRLHGSDVRSNSPQVTGTRRVSAVEDCNSGGDVLKASADLSKSYEELDGIAPSLEIAPSSMATAVLDSRVAERNLDEAVKRTSASEENLLSSDHRLNDVMDIKQLARLQEESLRLSYNAPLVMSKKGLSKSLNRSSGALVVDDRDGPEPDTYVTKSLNRSSSLRQPAVPAVNNIDTLPAKLDGSSRHTSRSASNLLSSRTGYANDRLSQPASRPGYAAAQRTSSSVVNDQLPVSVSNGARKSNAGGLRTLRSALCTNKQPTAKSEPRSTSLSAPRLNNAAARTGAASKNGLSLPAHEPASSLPSSPHSSDADSLNEPGEVACATLPRMRHQQSMPNLSRSSKLSLATTSTPTRSSAQQSARGALYTRRASAGQPLAAASLSRVKQPAPSQRTTSRTITPRQQPSSLRDFKTHAAREQSPSSSTALLAKTNDTTPRQPSRLVASSRSRIPSPGAQRNIVSTTPSAAEADDSWMDGCF